MHLRIWYTIFLLFPFFIIACTSAGDTIPEPAPQVAQADTATPVPPTDTATPLPPTETPAPTETPTSQAVEAEAETEAQAEVNTPTSTATSLPAPTETPTEMPTATLPPPTNTPTAVDALIPSISLALVAEGFDLPTYVTHAGDGSGRLFVIEKHGKVRFFDNGQLQADSFMDIDSLVGSEENEQGFLSLAFHPNFAENRQLFVNYTNNDGDTVIARYLTTPDLRTVDSSSAEILLTIPQPYRNHNGGQIQFGPDGYLYIGTGDGGSANDPQNNGQNLTVLLGKMLRISVDAGSPYAIPADNPFLDNPDFRPEIWSYGLRNPWRFSFDRQNGDMYIADVGQRAFEEVDFEPAGSSGLNYGWAAMEGLHCFTEPNCDPANYVLPIAEYNHDQGCSVTGGYVYRGSQYPTLNGVYFYGDYCSGTIWGIRQGSSAMELLSTDLTISTFGEDEAGELYVVDYQGRIYQVTTN